MLKRWLALILFFCLWFPSVALGEEVPFSLAFTWWGNEALDQVTQDAINQFLRDNRKTPISVQPRFINDRNSYAAWLTAQWSADSAGDLVELDSEMLRNLAKNGGAAQFTDLEPLIKALDLTQFSYLGLISCLVEGQISAVPISMSSHILVWNKAALKTLKAAVPSNLTEIKNLRTLSSQQDTYPMAASAESRMAWMITQLQSRYGRAWLNESNTAVGFTRDQVVHGLRELDNLEKARVWPKLSEQGDLAKGFTEGKYLGLWGWDNDLADALIAIPMDLKQLEIAAYLSDWQPYSGGFQKPLRLFAIPATSSAPTWSAHLIQFLLNSRSGARILKDFRGTPISTEGSAICRSFRLLDPIRTELNKIALSWAHYPMPFGFNAASLIQPDGVYEQVLLGISTGKLTYEAAADLLMEGIAEALR